jgi:Fe-S oxidoreductase
MNTVNKKKIHFKEAVMKLLPEGGNFDSCLACGICASACPATGLENMDPKKFLRMAALGMDEEITSTPWVWMCTMCQRCSSLCPMHIDIPQLVYYGRQAWPEEKKPKGIMGSCRAASENDTCSAIGLTEENFRFSVEDTLEDVHDEQKDMGHLKAPIDKKGVTFFLNQNSREPATESEEMVPLWKILDFVGADWTYASKGWAAENYCMFAADEANWEKIIRTKVKAVEDLGCRVWLNTE